MTLNENNDKYYGNLKLIHDRKMTWEGLHPQSKMYKRITLFVVLVGLACIVYVALQVGNADTRKEQLPLHISIWIVAAVAVIVNRIGKNKCAQPFAKLHNARFEASEEGLYYCIQYGMEIRNYFIKDEDIIRIVRDDPAGVVYFEGATEICAQSRKGEVTTESNGFYALIPFDKFDLDDLLEPYDEFVSVEPDTLRKKFDSQE